MPGLLFRHFETIENHIKSQISSADLLGMLSKFCSVFFYASLAVVFKGYMLLKNVCVP